MPSLESLFPRLPMLSPLRPFFRPSGMLFYSLLGAAVLGCGLFFDRTAEQQTASVPPAVLALRADFVREKASPEVQALAQWILTSADNRGQPFVVLDKVHARLFAFDGAGRLHGVTPALLGARRADDATVPATPAGRFTIEPGVSVRGSAVLWHNEQAALTLQGLAGSQAPGHGVRRLGSELPEDKRISDGSVHVPDRFYNGLLALMAESGRGVAYVLPETRPARDVFGSLEAASRAYAWQPLPSPSHTAQGKPT